MMNRIAYMSILILCGCNSLIEKTAPLEGEFYIQDGWLAFSAAKYEEADKHFNTAIETNDSGSVFHFLSLVGLGWTNIYKAQAIEETSSNGFVKIAGENLSAAHNIMLNINIEEAFFNKMKKKPYILNTSRSQCIKTNDLISAYKNKKIYISAVPDVTVYDPTGAGDSFAGGVLGYIASYGLNNPINAVIHGTVVASYTVSGFGLEKLYDINQNEFDNKIKIISSK